MHRQTMKVEEYQTRFVISDIVLRLLTQLTFKIRLFIRGKNEQEKNGEEK